VNLAALRHPRPERVKTRIWPVFLPHQGCRWRCRFCDQHLQTGRPDQELAAIHDNLEQELAGALAAGRAPLEIGFFGGTFTALPEKWQLRFLDLAREYRERGLLTRIRCSTRPDALSAEALAGLKARGLDMVELGVQSFSDRALGASGRGHDGEAAREGCRLVADSGLTLGLHLMPGLPGATAKTFLDDVDASLAFAPATVRLYPCLVLEGTALARDLARGAYRPTSLAAALALLGLALSRFWRAGVEVIRVGLVPEEALLSRITAGPWHPALGQRAASLALYDHIRAHLAASGGRPTGLRYPARFQSEVLGWRREMLPRYQALGLGAENMRPWPETFFLLQTG